MTCFCGCNDFEKNPNCQKVGCVKCGHGRQNHDDKYRESARRMKSSHKNETLILDNLLFV